MICFRSVSDTNQCASRHSDRNESLNDSTWALSVGFPRRDKSMEIPACYARKSIA